MTGANGAPVATGRDEIASILSDWLRATFDNDPAPTSASPFRERGTDSTQE